MQKKLKMSIVLILSNILSACNQNKSETATTTKEKRKPILNIVESGEISTLDSSIASDGLSFGTLNNVMEGLYMPGLEEKPVPGAAESHTVSMVKIFAVQVM